MIDDILKLKEKIEKAKNICVFTGAGISCPSGIPDFRSADGLYNKSHGSLLPERIISHTFFMSDPELFYEFYKGKMLYPSALPNAAHYYFSRLEKEGKNVGVITQNIDGLHQAAGSTEVAELHGSVHRNFCMKCGKYYDLDYIVNSDGVPKCDVCGSNIKPDVVLYEEQLNENVIEKALKIISGADMMIVVGTSLVVYPAASFIKYFNGSSLILINKSKTAYDSSADIVINDNIINVVSKLN
ncbi:MAG: NAD-dependent protein deacylase [Oscillospiraceae bacterium]|nr:NAD-dependent protein deacylase [Oscillospiraceae bacterium]